MTEKKFRFIPYRKNDIVEMLLQDPRFSGGEDLFRKMHHILDHVFHYEFHQTVEAMKNAYASVDPDSDTRNASLDQEQAGPPFVDLLCDLLEKANYERVTEEDINMALTESSLFKIRLHIDFDDFEEVRLFYRGESVKQETVPLWMGLFSKTISFTNFDRVAVYIRFREQRQQEKSPALSSESGRVLLKLFQNVPKADLEMLFPNTHVSMRVIDKFIIGVPAVVSGGIVLTTKLGASLVLLGSLLGFWLGLRNQPVELDKTALLVLLAGFTALGAYVWKQFNNFKNRKLRFMQALTRNLYFKNLDNNAGVFYRIADDAEEEECKEAILAYYFLLVQNQPLTKEELDQKIEQWFAEQWNCVLDFEINDALRKLLSLGMVQESGGGLTALPIAEAIRCLDQRWDAYFSAS